MCKTYYLSKNHLKLYSNLLSQLVGRKFKESLRGLTFLGPRNESVTGPHWGPWSSTLGTVELPGSLQVPPWLVAWLADSPPCSIHRESLASLGTCVPGVLPCWGPLAVTPMRSFHYHPGALPHGRVWAPAPHGTPSPVWIAYHLGDCLPFLLQNFQSYTAPSVPSSQTSYSPISIILSVSSGFYKRQDGTTDLAT